MKILLSHNYYSSLVPSGENQVFECERELIKKNGHDVHSLTRHSDDIRAKGIIGTFVAAILTPWNPFAARKTLKKIKDTSPDIIHIHNTFPLLSPSVFHAAKRKVTRVITLHNYRIYCPAAIPMKNGKPCTDCLDKRSSLPSLIHGCYRESRVATVPLALSVGLHRALNTWSNQVDAFIVLSDFQRNLMIDAGLPAHKVHVKPNFYPGNPEVVNWPNRKPYVVFAGRLTAEKGVVNLLRAWKNWGANAPELRLVGGGALQPELEIMASGLPVKFLGKVSSEEAQAQIANAQLLVLPSECFEGFPMVVREAFAFGTPVAVSNLGPLPSIVENGKSGIVFEPANPQSLLQEVRNAWENKGYLAKLGRSARLEFESKYTEEANYATLMDIYRKAIEVSRNE
ncbi:glycosyltransferase family 4 protein [Metapseudomonas resinovorans]|uniref:glycosyltransferase family 4 protein n=1 Tax=Metapseudomonas resinovorans TaxID=53412 RepID=UPI0009848241|nr:glycosyltransferase family 4 protein [Pseudomonas resinovorans]